MKNKIETTRILTVFFADCFKFWLIEGQNVMQALMLALRDISEVTRDPFEPTGDLLDADTKQEFINKIQKDLKNTF